MASGVEETLWAVWQSSQLAEHLMETSLRGGAARAGMRTRDLDAVMALFDFAGDSVELNPNLDVGRLYRLGGGAGAAYRHPRSQRY